MIIGGGAVFLYQLLNYRLVLNKSSKQGIVKINKKQHQSLSLKQITKYHDYIVISANISYHKLNYGDNRNRKYY